MLAARKALRECAKMTKSVGRSPTISVPVKSEDYGNDMFVTLGLEIGADSIDIEHWEGKTGEDLHIYYVGTIEVIDDEETRHGSRHNFQSHSASVRR